VGVPSEEVALSGVEETSLKVGVVTTRLVDEVFETDGGCCPIEAVDFTLALLGSGALACWVRVRDSSRTPPAGCTEVSCASSDPLVASSEPTGRSVRLEESSREGGAEGETTSPIESGVNSAVASLTLSSGEFRELGEVTSVAGEVAALWGEFPGAVGRPFPRAATLFPYSSRLFVEPASSAGGALRPKLLRGIGTPPFLSNLAILSRRLPRGGVRDASRGGGVGDGDGEGEPLRCWRAAMRSFKLFGGGGGSIADMVDMDMREKNGRGR